MADPLNLFQVQEVIQLVWDKFFEIDRSSHKQCVRTHWQYEEAEAFIELHEQHLLDDYGNSEWAYFLYVNHSKFELKMNDNRRSKHCCFSVEGDSEALAEWLRDFKWGHM